MKQLTIFRILSFLLVPVAILFAIMDIFLFVMAISTNPTLLFFAFVMACFVIYVFVSIKFLMSNIDQQKTSSSSLKDWIKVNAYASLFVAVLFLMNSMATFFINDINLRRLISEMMEQQPEISGKFSLDVFIKMFRVISSIMFCISAITIAHILIQFKLLKRYDYLFHQS